MHSEHDSLPAPLGIGLSYIAGLPAEIYRAPFVDFVEITPEGLCRERRTGNTASIELDRRLCDQAKATCGDLPMVVHGVELSIGSAHGWNNSYLEMLDEFQTFWRFRWHSEHLGFQTFPDAHGRSIEIGVPLPLPPNREAAHLVSRRCVALRERYGLPFLLENPAHYLQQSADDATIGDEIDFMNLVTVGGDCSQLLDLHNLYCNSINHRFDPFAALDRIAMDRVVEMHIAGGSWHGAFYMDAHDGCVPPAVWKLLEAALARTPHVAGVTFEILDEHVPRVGADAIVEELARARSIWQRCRPLVACDG